MKDIIQEIKDNKFFLIPYLCIWLCLAIFLLIDGKIESHLILNNYHTPSGDIFFKYFTEIGGWIPFIVAGILIFIRYKIAIIILLSQLVATLITTPIKHAVRAARPSVIFKDLGITIPIVEGVDLHSTLSFPSGHTSAAFAFCMAIAIFCPKTWQKLIFLFFAFLGGYSRIYLSQHFLVDVLIGSMIGVIAVIVIAPLTNKIKSLKYNTLWQQRQIKRSQP